MVGKSIQETIPYTFNIRNGFSPHSQLAIISLKEFSIFSTIGWGEPKYTCKYTIHYCLCEVEPYMEWMANFCVTVRSAPKLQVRKFYIACQGCQTYPFPSVRLIALIEMATSLV